MKNYTFTLSKKFSEKHIGAFIDEFYKEYVKHGNTIKYIFDLSSVEWMSNQELLVFTGLLKCLINESVKFQVTFIARDSGHTLDIRRAKNIIQIWETWKIFQIVPGDNFKDYFDIDGNTIDNLKRQFNITSSQNEIYSRYGVTPFVTLDYIAEYEDKKISEMLSEVYWLNEATSDILQKYKCYMPFENNTLSSIVTKELYENFLDHYKPSIFQNKSKEAFICIGLNLKLRGDNQSILSNNFKEESLSYFKNFFYDKVSGKFKNNSVLQLTFLDFGIGIPTTLKSQFQEKKGVKFSKADETIDSRILEYAFQFDSSKDPLSERYAKRAIIPRGLFDLLSIVQRFRGLIVVRSNYGKIFYDFSENKDEFLPQRFTDSNFFFPGTLISIYLPERETENKIPTTVIKPIIPLENAQIGRREKKVVSLYRITNKLIESGIKKTDLYSKVFEELINQVSEGNNDLTTIYIDFKDYDLDERISKKIIYFLLSDYNINQKNSVIIINPPPTDFLKQLQHEITLLPKVKRDYTIHPLPFISRENVSDLNVFWLGVYNNEDIILLNDTILESHSLRKSDFKDSDSVVGNVNYYDAYGNLTSLINREYLLEIFIEVEGTALTQNIDEILETSILKAENQIFLCNGNYYQGEYLQMYDILSDENNCHYLSRSLFDRIRKKKGLIEEVIYLCITPNSAKIGQSLIKQNLVNSDQVLFFESYERLIQDSDTNTFDVTKNVVLLCDVTSTGYLNLSIKAAVEKMDGQLCCTAVIVNAIDETFEDSKRNYQDIDENLIYLKNYPIKKYRRASIRDRLIDSKTKVIRIDPFTFSPVTVESRNLRQGNESTTLLGPDEFITLMPEKFLKAGYFRFNSLIHPYFFDMAGVLSEPVLNEILLTKIFEKFSDDILNKVSTIFYPKNSGVSELNFDFLKTKIFKNHKIEVYQLDRYGTNDGWRFPLLPSFLHSKTYSTVLILDDGSCSGESLIQMINEVSSLPVTDIIVLSIIGRISDHKKDFFSGIKLLSGPGNNKEINLKIFFGSHWHIPTYYVEESPVIFERNWLEGLLSYPNVPNAIKAIANNVLEELSVKDINGSSNRFLLKKKDGTTIIKDLILKKDEIGKIMSYHLYSDYFKFFDEIISTYENTIDFDGRYQKIELVCAVFLHEPYIFNRITKVLPDLTEKLQEFVQTILFGNPTKANAPRLDKEKLFHQWSNKNLIHFLFIVYPGQDLIDLLNYEKIKMLIVDFCKSDNDLSYLLFKLLRYYPVGRLDKSYDLKNENLANLINLLIDRQHLEPRHLKSLKRFRTFAMSLASSGNFQDLFTKIKHNYNKLIDDENHKDSLNLQRDIFDTQIAELKKEFRPETEAVILTTWDNISPFIADLLSFSKSFPEFFMCCDEALYHKLEDKDTSLRSLFGEINELLSTLNPSSKFDRIREISKQIFEMFITSGTEYFKIFIDDHQPIIMNKIEEFIDKLKAKGYTVKHPTFDDQTHNAPYSLDFSSYYIELIFIELLQNFRHSDVHRPVDLNWSVDSANFLTIDFSAYALASSQEGGGNGIARLERLNVMPTHNVQYHHKKEGDIFKQTLTFKII